MALLPDLPDAELVLHGKNMFLNRLKHGIGGGTTTSLQANGRGPGTKKLKEREREHEMKGIEIEETIKSVPIGSSVA